MSEQNQSGMIIYQTEDGLTKIDVAFENDTVWLSLEQMAELFQRDKSVISRHIKNIFSEGELEYHSVVAKNATTAADGKTYQVEYLCMRKIESVCQEENMSKIYSVPGIFGGEDFYDESGRKVGYSVPGLFGGWDFYNVDGQPAGHSVDSIIFGEDFYDKNGAPSGYSMDGSSGRI